ncbi:HNH endonuclease [Haloactinospora alba]|uniref:HNH endonuclease n=1 Tax=Haloactinospora alba TaxID=405555 RepID=UPI00115046EE|nr:HNH endonuclease signature motif containing protein [Haloactinospora alba]
MLPCSVCSALRYVGEGSLADESVICRDCRRKARERTCLWCGALFVASRPGRGSYCSRACCGKAKNGTTVSPAVIRPRPCADCGAEVRNSANTPLCEGCAKIRESARCVRKNRTRRALQRGAQAERYTLEEIASRDKRTCQLCGKRVAMARKYPDPKSPVIDHIIPIVEGGDDVRANVQLAHFVCNSRKGAHPAGEQLALIG